MDIKLPDDYVVLSPKSGKPNENRSLSEQTIDMASRASRKLVVIIGESKEYKYIRGKNIINLIGKTCLLEAMSIVSRANHFSGFQGLMSFVAMSHRVKSTVHVRSESDIHAVFARMPKQWEQYCSIVRD